jgi:hypothetical protein
MMAASDTSTPDASVSAAFVAVAVSSGALCVLLLAEVQTVGALEAVLDALLLLLVSLAVGAVRPAARSSASMSSKSSAVCSVADAFLFLFGILSELSMPCKSGRGTSHGLEA